MSSSSFYFFQNLSEDVASDVSDEVEIDELYEQSKIVFSIDLLDMFTTQMLPVYWHSDESRRNLRYSWPCNIYRDPVYNYVNNAIFCGKIGDIVDNKQTNV